MMSVDQRPQARPQSKSGFSLKSEKSHQSKESRSHKRKESLKESHEEKRKAHLSDKTKADPNAAMNEAQPLAAALEASTIGSLSSFQWRDQNGVPITEPDRSNPTRSRWERPLDTIRAFEASIDNEYKQRRSSMIRSDSSPDMANGYGSRRNSYYSHGGYESQGGPRNSNIGGYYGKSAAYRESYADGPQYAAAPSRNRYNQRLQSDPALSRPDYNNGVYPGHGYQRSRDTINTGSNGSEPAGSGRSSENSSIERVPAPPVKQPDLGEQYGFNGFGNTPILEEYGRSPGSGHASGSAGQYQTAYGQNGGYYENPGAVPGPAAAPREQPRAPIRLGGAESSPASQSNGNSTSSKPSLKRNESEKRKSWFKRRFSKE